MWVVRELWFHRRQYYLNVVANAMAVFLVLTVSILSDSLRQGISHEIGSLGLDVTMLQVYSDVDELWFDDFCRQFGIEKAAPCHSFQHEGFSVVSCNEKLYELFEPEMFRGRFLNETDVRNNDNHAVMGYEAYLDNDRRDTVSVNGVTFTVIGVLKKAENNLFIDYDDSIFIPEGYDLCQASRTHVYYYEDDHYTESYLDDAFGKNGYMLVNQSYLLNSTEEISELIRKVLIFIAGVSLAVSLIGMVNSVLSNIRERSYEIGIKKVMGASTADIYGEFALESFAVFFLGMLAGLLLVTVVFLVIDRAGLMSVTVDYSGNMRLVTRLSLAGFLCGLYPAYRAGRISIMEAIRKV